MHLQNLMEDFKVSVVFTIWATEVNTQKDICAHTDRHTHTHTQTDRHTHTHRQTDFIRLHAISSVPAELKNYKNLD